MYYIYMDEAGQAANEPVTIVTGIIVEAFQQHRIAEEAIFQAMDMIPAAARSRVPWISARKIWNDPDIREHWPAHERREFLKHVLEIPRKLGLPIAIGKTRRDASTGNIPALAKVGIREDHFQHFLAFKECLWSAERFLSANTSPSCQGWVRAEDVSEHKKLFSYGVELLRIGENMLGIEFAQTSEDRELGRPARQESFRRAHHLQSEILFLKKGDPRGALLQIADVCAFGFRRYLAELSYGVDLCTAMLGNELNMEDWKGPRSGCVWTFHSPLGR